MDYPRYLVDIHTHCFPDAVAPRAMANLIAEYRVNPVGDGTLGNLRQHMAASRVSASIVLPVATRPDQVASINDWAASVNSPDVVAFRSRAESPAGDEGLFVQGNYRGRLSNTWGVLRLYDHRNRPVATKVFFD